MLHISNPFSNSSFLPFTNSSCLHFALKFFFFSCLVCPCILGITNITITCAAAAKGMLTLICNNFLISCPLWLCSDAKMQRLTVMWPQINQLFSNEKEQLNQWYSCNKYLRFCKVSSDMKAWDVWVYQTKMEIKETHPPHFENIWSDLVRRRSQLISLKNHLKFLLST